MWSGFREPTVIYFGSRNQMKWKESSDLLLNSRHDVTKLKICKFNRQTWHAMKNPVGCVCVSGCWCKVSIILYKHSDVSRSHKNDYLCRFCWLCDHRTLLFQCWLKAAFTNIVAVNILQTAALFSTSLSQTFLSKLSHKKHPSKQSQTLTPIRHHTLPELKCITTVLSYNFGH